LLRDLKRRPRPIQGCRANDDDDDDDNDDDDDDNDEKPNGVRRARHERRRKRVWHFEYESLKRRCNGDTHGVDEKVVLWWVLKKWCVKLLAELFLVRIGTSGGSGEISNQHSNFFQ
jgi:hypothetical protein